MATQKAFASYQEIYDLHTESDRVTVLGIHTPQGNTPRKMFGGFFDQFKKYRYVGASITLVPAARLPVDPLGVSYQAGEPTIDPRDVLNPILWHGCHGNDLGSILNRLYGNPTCENAGDSLDVLEAGEATQLDWVGRLQRLYYQALTDNTWRKAHPQKGFRKSGLRPLVYSLASTRQIAPGSLNGTDLDDVLQLGDPFGDFSGDTEGPLTARITRDSPQLITPRLTSLGWLDTRNVMIQYDRAVIESPSSDSEEFERQQAMVIQNEVCLPKIFMGVILLPPAYKTEQYFRMIVTHHFAFKGFRGISMNNEDVGFGLPDQVVNANDGFTDNGDNEAWEPGSTPAPVYRTLTVRVSLKPPYTASQNWNRIGVLVNGSIVAQVSSMDVNTNPTAPTQFSNLIVSVGDVVQVIGFRNLSNPTLQYFLPAEGVTIESGEGTQILDFTTPS